MPTIEPLTLIAGAILFVCLIIFTAAYLLNNHDLKMETIQGIARRLGLFAIVTIVFESILMEHLYIIHGIALICALALWIIGLLEDDQGSAVSEEQVSESTK